MALCVSVTLWVSVTGVVLVTVCVSKSGSRGGCVFA